MDNFGIAQSVCPGVSAQGENFAFPDDGEWPCGRTVGKDDDGAERFRFIALKAEMTYPSDYDAG